MPTLPPACSGPDDRGMVSGMRVAGTGSGMGSGLQARVGYQLARGCLELGLAIRLHDLDLLYQTAGLAAPEHGAELVGVKGPRQDHLVLLILHFVEDEFSSGCTRDVSRTGPISYARENNPGMSVTTHLGSSI